MRSLYRESDALALEDELGPSVPRPLALRTYTARLLGQDPALVLHGGGNTSVKATVASDIHGPVDVLYVKGSGWDLATIEPAGHPAVRLEPLLRLRALPFLSDEAMVSELRANLLDASSPTPSVETLLHAFLPARFIDHTHADAVLSIADQPDGEAVCRRVFGDGLVWVPYVMPGFLLAKRCAEAFEAHAARGKVPGVIVLERHGIFSFGETAEESYGRMIDAVSAAEDYVRSALTRVATPASVEKDTHEAAAFVRRLRGVLGTASRLPPERGPILHTRSSPAILSFLARADAEALASVGCATPDHVIRTKPTPLFLRRTDTDSIRAEVDAYADRYDAYFHAMCASKGVTKTKLDPWPRVVLAPGVGVVTVGATAGEARIAADVYEHTALVIVGASSVGRYAPVSMADLFDVEYWSLEQAKLKKTKPLPLAQAVALVTGAASGIGKATALRLLYEGAHVVIVDRDGDGLDAAVRSVTGEASARLSSVRADVTSATSVEDAFEHACRTFGGVDVVVSNAGTAPEGDLYEPAGASRLRTSLEVNLLAHNEVASSAIRVFREQGRGGCLLFNISKAAFTPGPHFGPYAVAKSALLALMRQYAVDAAAFGIRSNGVNADRIRTGLFDDGVAESRARARGLTVEQYFRANLLSREVTADDVADAFVYLASARSTTGCVITVDGGNAAAFPR